MMKKYRNFLLILLVVISPPLQAAVFPVSVGVFPLFQFPTKDYTITGTRLSLLWGKHQNVYGLDLGFIGNSTEKDFVGTSLAGLFNQAGTTTILGAQMTFGANITNGALTVLGVQLAGLFNSASAKGNVYGLQMAFVGNFVSETNIHGAQIGIYNRASEVFGLQIGVVNQVDYLHGVQIGIINFNSKGFLPAFPVINVGL